MDAAPPIDVVCSSLKDRALVAQIIAQAVLRCRANAVDARSGLDLVVDLESGLLGRRGESAGDTRHHAWHENVVTEALPALTRVMHGDDRPAVGGLTAGMIKLPVGQTPTQIGRASCRERAEI